MSKLWFTRGLPGSGKTTFAKAWVSEGVDSRARVNRDDLRAMLHDSHWEKGVTEQTVIAVRDAIITSLLKRGVDVINDDTNLPQRTARDLRRLAESVGAEWEVIDLTNVSVDDCILQDLLRDKYVGETVIRSFYERFVKGKSFPLPLPEEKTEVHLSKLYKPNESLPKAAIFDIDGTVALRGDRDWYDESKVHTDRPNVAVVDAVRHYSFLGYKIIFCSGRKDDCYGRTYEWLKKNVTTFFESLVMRPSGDNRQDAVVKDELFEKYIAPNYNVKVVFDDRNQVVEMWRAKGLTCFQVAEGNF